MSTYSTEHKLGKATVALFDKWLLTIDQSKKRELSFELDKLKEDNRLKNDKIEGLKKKIGYFENSKSNEKNAACSYSAVLSG